MATTRYSIAIFCIVFLNKLRRPAWAVGNYSIGPPVRIISQKHIQQNIVNKGIRNAVEMLNTL